MGIRLQGIVDAAFERLDYDSAVAALLKMPPSAERDVRLARAYRCLDRHDLCRKYAEPHHLLRSDAAFEYGMVRLGFGGPAEAWGHFERSVELEPNADALNGMAFLEELRSRGEDREKLYAIFERGFALDPNHPGLLQTFGIAQMNDGKLGDALQTFQRVLAHWSKEDVHRGTEPHFDALCNLACVETKLGESSAALDHIEAALEAPRLRHYRRLRIRGDADLAALHEHARFWEIIGESPVERPTPASEAPVSPHTATVPITPDHVKTLSGSDQFDEVELACRILAGLVEARYDGFYDRYEGSHSDHDFESSEKLIALCLSDTGWLLRHLKATTVPVHLLELLEQLLTLYGYAHYGDPLAELQLGVARELVPDALARWAHEPGERFPVQGILENLEFSDQEGNALSPNVSRALAECLERELPAPNRRWVLTALQGQATDQQGSALASLLASNNAEDVRAGLVASIHLARENVDWQRWFQRPEAAVRELIAKEFAVELGEERLLGYWDECDAEARDRLIERFLEVLGPNFAPRAIEYCRTGQFLRQTLLWLQKQKLRDADILLFATVRPSTMTGNAPLRTRHDMSVGVLRSHHRTLSCSAAEVGLPVLSVPPTVFTASVVGYLGVRERVQWLRDHYPRADRLTTSAIVQSIGLVGDASDLDMLRALGKSDPKMLEDAWVARMLLGDSLELLDAVSFRFPSRMWALERLFDMHWPKERARLSAALKASTYRGLFNGDEEQFLAAKARLQNRVG